MSRRGRDNSWNQEAFIPGRIDGRVISRLSFLSALNLFDWKFMFYYVLLCSCLPFAAKSFFQI